MTQPIPPMVLRVAQELDLIAWEPDCVGTAYLQDRRDESIRQAIAAIEAMEPFILERISEAVSADAELAAYRQ